MVDEFTIRSSQTWIFFTSILIETIKRLPTQEVEIIEGGTCLQHCLASRPGKELLRKNTSGGLSMVFFLSPQSTRSPLVGKVSSEIWKEEGTPQRLLWKGFARWRQLNLMIINNCAHKKPFEVMRWVFEDFTVILVLIGL